MKLIFKNTEIPTVVDTNIIPTTDYPTVEAGVCRLQKDDYVIAADEVDLFDVDTKKTAECLDLLYQYLVIDYQLFRTSLKRFGNLDNAAWDALDVYVKELVCYNKCTTEQRIVDVLGNSWRMVETISSFDEIAANSRMLRYRTIKTMVLRYTSDIDGLLIRNDLLNYCVNGTTNSNQREDYVVDGFIGLGEDLFEAIIDYANATTAAEALAITGSSTDPFGNSYGKYETIGLRAKTITMRPTSPYTQEEMVDLIIEHLLYGYNRTLKVY